MFFAPELHFRNLSKEALQALSYNIQRKLLNAEITPVNRRVKPTEWHFDDDVGFWVRENSFLVVGLKGAVIAPEHAGRDVLNITRHTLGKSVDIVSPDPGNGVLGMVAFAVFLFLYSSGNCCLKALD